MKPICTTWAKQLIKLVTKVFCPNCWWPQRSCHPAFPNHNSNTKHCTVDIVQVSSSCSTKPFRLHSHWRPWVRTHTVPSQKLLVVSPYNQTLSFPPLSNFFHSANMLAHPGTTMCSYMVTRIRELIRVENSSAKEKDIFNTAEFTSQVLGAVVVPWGGCSMGPTESGSGEGSGRSWHCSWAASLLVHTAVTAERTCSSWRKCIS